MNNVSEKNLSREEARKRIGLGKRDRVADYLPMWLEAEERLAKLVGETEDFTERAKYEEDLKSLREVLQVLKKIPVSPRSTFGIWLWAVLVAITVIAGIVGYQKWVGFFGKKQPVAEEISLEER
jgi:hypothetical protein